MNTYYYLAGAIEHAGVSDEVSWKEQIIMSLRDYTDVIPYNPVTNEVSRTGRSTEQNCEYIKLLKKRGNFDRLSNVMSKIWWGDFTNTSFSKLNEISEMAQLGLIPEHEFHNLGDFAAVAASSFIVAHLPKDVKTVGTYAEITLAYFLRKRIFVICPDQKIEDINSSLIYFSRSTLGAVSSSVDRLSLAIKSYLEVKKLKDAETQHE